MGEIQLRNYLYYEFRHLRYLRPYPSHADSDHRPIWNRTEELLQFSVRRASSVFLRTASPSPVGPSAYSRSADRPSKSKWWDASETLPTLKELLKRLRQKRTAQKQHGIVIVIQPERIPDHHIHPIVFLRPLLRCPAGDLVDFDTAQPAGRMAFQQISKNAPLPASDIQKNILLSQCDKSVTPLFYPCVLLLRNLMNTGDFYIHIVQTYFDILFNRWRRIPVM